MEAFTKELKALCEKYEVTLEGISDEMCDECCDVCEPSIVVVTDLRIGNLYGEVNEDFDLDTIRID